MRHADGYYLNWRLLSDELYDTPFNVYRGSTRLNAEPLTGQTGLINEKAPENSVYNVKAIVEGKEQPSSHPARIINLHEGEYAAYFDIPLKHPPQGEHGGSYHPNDASAGDLNGDGQYEIVVKWDPDNATKDNSQWGTTDNVYLDAFTLEGTLLWRIDLGPNIRAGTHYTQFMAYDFYGNGNVEIMPMTALGTRNGRSESLKGTTGLLMFIS